MTRSLQIVGSQFPHLRERVVLLFERDDAFRELCDDYETCLGALSRLEAAASPGLRAEYAALRLRLETEMLRRLEETTDAPGDTRQGK
jgi:hypothetical protein